MGLQVFINVSGVQGHASVQGNVFGSTFKDHRNLIGCTNNWNNTFGISNPFQNFSLSVWIASVNLVENHTGLARFGVFEN